MDTAAITVIQPTRITTPKRPPQREVAALRLRSASTPRNTGRLPQLLPVVRVQGVAPAGDR